MPEGDTVFVLARRLGNAIAGEVLRRTDFRVPRFATVRLDGRRVEDVHARGKHLFIRVEGGRTIHSHLAMEGEWHIYSPQARWTRPATWARVVLETSRWIAVGYRLAKLELIESDQEDELFSYLGPDPLGPEWDPAEAMRRLAAVGELPIADALLDQSVMAGPGNVYKCEICFLRGLYPWTQVADVEDLRGVVTLTARVMRANRDEGMQVTTGDNRPGRRHWVYGRGGEPCLRCGTSIARSADAPARVTYWCPRCQPKDR